MHFFDTDFFTQNESINTTLWCWRLLGTKFFPVRTAEMRFVQHSCKSFCQLCKFSQRTTHFLRSTKSTHTISDFSTADASVVATIHPYRPIWLSYSIRLSKPITCYIFELRLTKAVKMERAFMPSAISATSDISPVSPVSPIRPPQPRQPHNPDEQFQPHHSVNSVNSVNHVNSEKQVNSVDSVSSL